MTRGATWLCSGALVALALGAAPAHAASIDAAGTTIVAFADSRPTPPASTLPYQLGQLKQAYCVGKGDRGRPLSLDAALGVARRLVAADSKGHGLAAVGHSTAGRKESRAVAAAAGALGRGKPAAALAALLRAHQLAPRDPVPLIDAAPLLSEAGRGRAALAVLDVAKRLRAPRTNPFGISWSALILANRGQALIATHQYAKATATLSKALKSAPLLREAEQNMTVALECQGKQAQAQRFYFGAWRRQSFAKGDFAGQTPADPIGQLNEGEVLDTSKGQTLTLQTFKYPQTMDEGRAQRASYLALERDITGRQEPAGTQQERDDRTAMEAELAKAAPATRQRTQDILFAIQAAASNPDIAGLQRQAGELHTQFGPLQLRSYGQGGCMDAGLHSTWLSLVQAYDTAERKFAVALYNRQTALAANLKSPAAHQVGLDIAREGAVSNLFNIVDGGNLIAAYDAICDPSQDSSGSDNPVSGDNQMPASEPCPSGITGPDYTLNLLVFSFGVTCEEVTVEGEIGEGWLNGFVSVSHSFTKGSNTIYAGAQAGAKVSIGPLSGGATARGGVYVTFAANGAVQDVGLRGTTSESASVGVGPAGGSASISGPDASLSLAGAFTAPSI